MNKTPPSRAIAIFCTSLEIGQEPISSDYYWDAYLDLLLALKRRGVEAYFVTNNATYAGNGRFTTAYTTDIKISGPHLLKQVHNVSVDAVFERAESNPFVGRDIPVINPESIRHIANNKIAIYQHFSELQPYSAIVNNRAELTAAVQSLSGDKAVVKEPDGYGGDAVYIGTKSEVLEQTPDNHYPLLVQEFLDTSGGIPGYQSGVHDVRIEICGGKITGYYVRMAKPGTYHSNIHRGGHMTFLPIERVPLMLQSLVEQIDRTFAPAPRFYAADFAHTPQGWKLIELNDYVGLARLQHPGNPTADDNEAIKTLDRLSDYLVSVASAPAAS